MSSSISWMASLIDNLYILDLIVTRRMEEI